MLRNKDHNKMGTMLLAGLGSMAAGCVLFFMGFFSVFTAGSAGMAVAGLGVLLFLVGGGVCLFVLVSGIRAERADASTTEVVIVPDCRVTARYFINGIGETVFDIDYFDPGDAKSKLYVKLEIPGRRQMELRTNAAVWAVCGEGLRGTAHVQGSWLGQFERPAPPKPGVSPYDIKR